MIGDDFYLTFVVGDFGGFEADIRNYAFKTVGLGDNGVTHPKLVFCDDSNPSDEIFKHILEGETDDGGDNPKTGQQGCNIHPKHGKDNQKQNYEEDISQNTRKHFGNSLDALFVGGAGVFAASVIEDNPQDPLQDKIYHQNKEDIQSRVDESFQINFCPKKVEVHATSPLVLCRLHQSQKETNSG